jgi:radical SAM-linked protein
MTDPNQPIRYPLLVRFAKAGFMRFVGHLDWLAIQQAMFLRAGFPMGIGEGPTHRLKIKTTPPTPVGVESRAEFTYVLLSEPLSPDEAVRRLIPHCPDGIQVLATKDAGLLIRKNPFGTIEAASYSVDLGNGTTENHILETLNLFENIKSLPMPSDIEPDEIKQFWGRIIEFDRENGAINLFVHQREGDTFHGARCAAFLEKRLGLPHYPLFSKLDYYRLKPSKRRLFR